MKNEIEKVDPTDALWVLAVNGHGQIITTTLFDVGNADITVFILNVAKSNKASITDLFNIASEFLGELGISPILMLRDGLGTMVMGAADKPFMLPRYHIAKALFSRNHSTQFRSQGQTGRDALARLGTSLQETIKFQVGRVADLPTTKVICRRIESYCRTIQLKQSHVEVFLATQKFLHSIFSRENSTDLEANSQDIVEVSYTFRLSVQEHQFF